VAQFDVYRNPGRRSPAIPFVVSLQCGRLERAATRLVAPLVLRGAAREVEDHPLTPTFEVAGASLWLDIFNLATVPVARLGEAVASLADDESRAKLIRALDELVSQA
jgi:toxin CcdB